MAGSSWFEWLKKEMYICKCKTQRIEEKKKENKIVKILLTYNCEKLELGAETSRVILTV